MKLSIIIVNYNTKDITLSCLKSLEKYPLKKPFEVILVDNGSTDGSKEKFSKFKTKKYNFVYIYKNSNLGFSKGNNIGLRRSKGEYKLLLNSDTEVTKDALNKLVELAENNSEVGIVGSRLLNTDKSLQASVFRLPSINRAFRQYILGRGNILDKYAPKSKKPSEVEVLVGAVFLITPDAYKKVGLLNEKYFMYFEDFDYCRAVRKAGLKIYYLPDSVVIHHHGASKGDWRKLISSSKTYHGVIKHYIIFLITWLGQKKEKLFGF